MEELIDRSPIAERTPKTEAMKALYGLAGIHGEAFGNSDDFFEYCVKRMWNDEKAMGDQLISRISTDSELPGWTDNPIFSGEREARTLIAIMRVACAFAIQSLKSEEMSNAAWSYACKASEWVGFALGFFSHCGRHKDLKTISKKGGHAKDKKMEKLRQWTLDAYDAKAWPSQYKASFDLAEPVIQKAPEFETRLSEQNAQKTIYGWLRKNRPTNKAE